MALGFRQDLARHCLTEADGGGLEMAAAFRTLRGRVAVCNPFAGDIGVDAIAAVLGETGDFDGRSVDFEDPACRQAGALVEAVDVLRDHGGEFAGAFEVDESAMSGVGLSEAHLSPGFALLTPILDAVLVA